MQEACRIVQTRQENHFKGQGRCSVQDHRAEAQQVLCGPDLECVHATNLWNRKATLQKADLQKVKPCRKIFAVKVTAVEASFLPPFKAVQKKFGSADVAFRIWRQKICLHVKYKVGACKRSRKKMKPQEVNQWAATVNPIVIPNLQTPVVAGAHLLVRSLTSRIIFKFALLILGLLVLES